MIKNNLEEKITFVMCYSLDYVRSYDEGNIDEIYELLKQYIPENEIPPIEDLILINLQDHICYYDEDDKTHDLKYEKIYSFIKESNPLYTESDEEDDIMCISIRENNGFVFGCDSNGGSLELYVFKSYFPNDFMENIIMDEEADDAL